MGKKKQHLSLTDNRLYKIVDTKIIDKIVYSIGTYKYNILQWHEHGICYIAYFTTITQSTHAV